MFKQTMFAGKVMTTTVFWDRKGILLCEFMTTGTTINVDCYCEILKNLHRAIPNKRKGMLTKGVCFPQRNARSYTAHTYLLLVSERHKFNVRTHTRQMYYKLKYN